MDLKENKNEKKRRDIRNIKHGKFKRELLFSEAKYLDLLQEIPDIIYKIDPKGIFTYINDSIQQLGYMPNELIGKHFSTIIHPEDVKNVSRSFVLPKYRGQKTGDKKAPKLFDERRGKGRETEALEVRLISKNKNESRDGYIKIISEVSAAGLYNKEIKDKFLGTVGIIRDITERKSAIEAFKRSEEKYRQIVEIAQEGILVVDPVFDITFVNPRMTEILGYSASEMVGESLYFFSNNEDAKIIREIMEKYREGKFLKEENRHDFEFQKKDKTSVYISLSATLIRSESGEFNGALFLIEDITLRKKAGERLLLTLEQLQNANLEISTLLESSQAVLKYADFNEAAIEIFNACMRLMKVDKGHIALLQQDEIFEILPINNSKKYDFSRKFPDCGKISGLSVEVYKTKRAMFYNNLKRNNLPEGHIQFDNALLAPLNIEGKIAGVLYLADKEGGFTEVDIKKIEPFANLISIALNNYRTLELLFVLFSRDRVPYRHRQL